MGQLCGVSQFCAVAFELRGAPQRHRCVPGETGPMSPELNRDHKGWQYGFHGGRAMLIRVVYIEAAALTGVYVLPAHRGQRTRVGLCDRQSHVVQASIHMARLATANPVANGFQ